MFTPAQLAAEHARAMRIVDAVLAACDARAATARAARERGLKLGDAPWVLAVGKAAVGMGEGLKDVCGDPHRHLVVTVDGPSALSLTNVVRSDHPLPTQHSVDAGRTVKRFIEEAKAARAPSLTVLISGGASSLICEPLPGIELDDYRQTVQAMLRAGWDIGRMNTVRRAIDMLKGGELALLAEPIPIDLLVISDVINDPIHDIGSGPFVWSPTTPEDAREIMLKSTDAAFDDAVVAALACRARASGLTPPRRTVVALNNASAVSAASSALAAEGLKTVSLREGLTLPAQQIVNSASLAVRELGAAESLAWGGEWPTPAWAADGYGGRCQFVAAELAAAFSGKTELVCCLSLATDGVDGSPPPGRPAAAGAFLYSGMSCAPVIPPTVLDGGEWPAEAVAEGGGLPVQWWAEANSYHVIVHRDRHRREDEPPAHVFTGPTGTNVNDLLIAWRP